MLEKGTKWQRQSWRHDSGYNMSPPLLPTLCSNKTLHETLAKPLWEFVFTWSLSAYDLLCKWLWLWLKSLGNFPLLLHCCKDWFFQMSFCSKCFGKKVIFKICSRIRIYSIREMETFVFKCLLSGIGDHSCIDLQEACCMYITHILASSVELHIDCVLERSLAIILCLPTGFAQDKFLLSSVGVLQLITSEIRLAWTVTLSMACSYLKALLFSSLLFQ